MSGTRHPEIRGRFVTHNLRRPGLSPSGSSDRTLAQESGSRVEPCASEFALADPRSCENRSDLLFFRLSSLELGLIIFAVIVGSTLVGLVAGSYLRRHKESLREPFGVLQAALLGLVGLILAFGLTLAVGRYEDRRAAVVDEANAIGTTYLRAQTLAEPQRSRSLALLRTYTDTSILLSHEIPGSTAARTTIAPAVRCSASCGDSRGRRSTTRLSRALRASMWRA